MFFCEINRRHLVSVISLHGKHTAKLEGNMCVIPLTTFNFQTAGWTLILKFAAFHRI